MAHLFWPDAVALKKSGFAAIAHVPVIFGATWIYLKDENRYLRERALLEWRPTTGISDIKRRLGNVRYPTRTSLENFGRRVINFFEWREWRNLPLDAIEYTTHIVKGYQADMQEGRWSMNGLPLKTASINAYVGEACSYVLWAGCRGIRKPFELISNPKLVESFSATNSHGHLPTVVEGRAGKIPVHQESLRLPTPAEVSKWLSEVRARHGETKALVCDLILQSAVRIQEAVQWRVDTLPEDRSTWNVTGDTVQVVIRYGAKGYKIRDARGEEHGPPRTIDVPLVMAQRLHEYRLTRRLAARRVFVRLGKDARERAIRRGVSLPRRLFLSETTGEPFSDEALYQSWTNTVNRPYKGWSPHKGRHYWACMALLRSIRRHAESSGVAIEMLSGDWVTGQCMSDIDIVIRPQLGHVNRQTTEGYLKWVTKAVTLTNIYAQYDNHLAQEDD